MESNQKQHVTAVGNSWIICKSKSHPGHNYYFNTLTGDAVWNLSEQEISNARCATKILEDQFKTNFGPCPEPRDEPPTKNFTSGMGYNHHMINNQYPNNSLPITPLICTQSALLSTIAPFNSLDFNATQPKHNPNIWDLNVASKLMVLPAVTQLKQQQQPVNIGYSLQHEHSLSPMASKRFENKNGINGFGIHRHKNNFKNNFIRKGKPNLKNISNQHKNIFNDSTFQQSLQGIKNNGRFNKGRHCGHETNKLQLEQDEDCVSIVDCTPLKSLKKSTANEECWYIVVDTNVLMNNFNYLTSLTSTDLSCYFLVPQCVVNRLEYYAEHDENMAARRLLRFLSDYSYIGNEELEINSKIKSASETSKIYNVCVNLENDNYHVVLISDNRELLKHKNIFNVISMIEVKNMVSNYVSKRKFLTKFSDKPSTSSSERVITITNNNDVEHKNNSIAISPKKELNNLNRIPRVQESGIHQKLDLPLKNATKLDFRKELIVQISQIGPENSVRRIIGNDKLTNEHELFQRSTRIEGIPVECKSPCKSLEPLKPIEDLHALYQKPEDDLSTHVRKNKTEIEKSSPKISQATKNESLENDDFNCINESLKLENDCHPVKKTRSIKLNRNINSNKNLNENEQTVTQEKKYKWRKRRDLVAESNPTPSQVNSCETLTEISKSSEHEKYVLKNKTLGLKEKDKKLKDYNIGNDENIHSFVDAKKKIDEYMIIKETSSSKTNSDSNFEQSNLLTDFEHSNHNLLNPVMFQVKSELMEDNLKLKSDEWVARFYQIMEDVLSQILRQDPVVESATLSPPWSLQEAVQCIIKKFYCHCYVVEAANKLSIILNQTSGKSISSILPAAYMKMYSYGVYLVKALKDVSKTCEDLEVALKSLSDLLRDIENPNSESSPNDTFVEASAENEDKEVVPVKDKIKENVMVTFMSSDLPDRNVDNERKDSNEHIDEVKEIRDKNVAKGLSENQFEDEAKTNSGINQPKIVRRFTKFVDFEERLKNSATEIQDLESVIFSNAADNYSIGEINANGVTSSFDDRINMIASIKTVDEAKRQVNIFFVVFFNELKYIFDRVQEFCKRCAGLLKKSRGNLGTCKSLQIKIEEVHSELINICHHLNSLLSRENGEDGIQKLLNKAGKKYCIDDKESEKFRKTTIKCREQANLLLKTVEYISVAVKKLIN